MIYIFFSPLRFMLGGFEHTVHDVFRVLYHGSASDADCNSQYQN